MNEQTRTQSRRSRLLVGTDWIIQGIVSSEAGVDLVLSSQSEPVEGFDDSVQHHRDRLDEAGVTMEWAESDAVTAGLLRAGMLAGRRIVAVFSVRGLRQALDALYDATRARVPENGGAVVVACDSDWSATAVRPRLPVSASSASSSTRQPSESLGPSADIRELAMYLGVPVLAPSSPPEAARFVNEAMRLSRASGSIVMLLLSPALTGGGGTPAPREDPVERAVPGALDPSEPDGTSRRGGLLLEARRRQIDRLLNAPTPGELVPVGFITHGTAHAALRHSLYMLGLTNKLPILKLGYANPLDRRSVEQFLVRCEKVIVVEGGQPIIERAVLAIAHDLAQKMPKVADVHGKRWPNEAGLMVQGIPGAAEIHPSDLADRVGELVCRYRPAEAKSTLAQLQRLRRQAGRDGEGAYTETSKLIGDSMRRARRPDSLVHTLARAALVELGEELSRPGPDRPSLELRVESIETASLEERRGARAVIELERRKLPSVGRAAIAHAIRRRLSTTFVILPDPPGSRPGLSTSDADRMARSIISSTEASRAVVSTLDVTDGPAFRNALRREIVSEGVSVVLLDTDQYRRPENVAGNPEDWAESGFAPVEVRVRPSSGGVHLCLEWLVHQGWNDPAWLDGAHGPRIDRVDLSDPLLTPLDGWDGFEELIINRRHPPLEDVPWLRDVTLNEPSPQHGREPFWRAHLSGPPGPGFDQAVALLEEAGRRMDYRVQVLRGIVRETRFAQIVFSRPRPDEPAQPITARIPFGSADVVIALDLESLLEAVAPGGPHRVACPERTFAIVDVSMPLAESFDLSAPPRAPVIPGELNRLLPPSNRAVFRAGEMCERILSSRRLVGGMLIGIAHQRGLIPLSSASLERSARRMAGDPLGQLPAALRLGRALAEWEKTWRPSSVEVSAPRPESLVRRHRLLMGSRPWPGARRRAQSFADLALGTLDAITGLRRGDPNRTTEAIFIARLIDCEHWGGIRYSRKYADRVREVYAAERSVEDYPLTRLVIQELGRAMLIHDPVFVAATMLRPDRLRKDWRRLGAKRHLGDHLTFRVRGRMRSAALGSLVGDYWRLGPAGCGVVSRMRFLRWWPLWYRENRHYRTWVESLTDRCVSELPQAMSLWLEVLGQLARVRGYGPRRTALARRIRDTVESLLYLSEPASPPETRPPNANPSGVGKNGNQAGSP